MSVKRLQIMIPEDLDDRLGAKAALEGVSKAELVRRYVGDRLRPLPPLEEDPLWEIRGIVKGDDEYDSSRINELLYEP